MRTTVVPAVVGLVLLASTGCGEGSAADGPARAEIVDAFTTEATTALAVYLDLDNDGGDDRIVGADLVGDSAGLAAEVTLHETAERDGLSIMEPADAIDIAGGTENALAPADAHIMLERLTRKVTTDDVVSLRLDLDRAEDMTIEVRVVTADEAVGLLTEEER
ncbi:copper chaperone PCu(A)C [Iamia majanohamensis]|uniref:Copper chaperone PCu(A)C n=1 Tax=Iamia majanohamensis TaxID=467976 RepID=A0AAE9YHQ0_9ACTN|nr:copper chaperone PCu(A)C [Iamia majanohamensis]WCO67991.1 copper chaperone PCu(A)C [Iamia majanohamensis]